MIKLGRIDIKMNENVGLFIALLGQRVDNAVSTKQLIFILKGSVRCNMSKHLSFSFLHLTLTVLLKSAVLIRAESQ